MPQQHVQFVQGSHYHLYNRGAGRASVFVDDTDYRDFLLRFKGYVARYQVQVIAYCLMPNHFHFLVRQDGIHRASLPVQYTCNGYVQRFNQRHRRQGTLFQGRYSVRRVTDDIYLRHLCRYIHANPVKDGFAARPDLWPYSNYLEWAGQRPGNLVDSTFIEQHFPDGSYPAFVNSYLLGKELAPPGLRAFLEELEQ
jgi:REP element-mobilizing transposase RayT